MNNNDEDNVIDLIRRSVVKNKPDNVILALLKEKKGVKMW